MPGLALALALVCPRSALSPAASAPPAPLGPLWLHRPHPRGGAGPQ